MGIKWLPSFFLNHPMGNLAILIIIFLLPSSLCLLLLHQVFIEHLLCAKPSAKHWGYGG